MTRPRACGAMIRGGMILMVRHRDPSREYWTLPGGRVEEGESFAGAAVRETLEETGLRARAVRLLWRGEYGDPPSPEECHLLEPEGEGQEIGLGHDPEEAHLPSEERLLRDVAWRPLQELRDDGQVARVLLALGGVDGL